MRNKFKKTALSSALSLLMVCPAIGLAYDGSYWDYHGSGRDHPYSAYIDRANYVGYADYAPDYVDWSAYINNVPAPATTPLSLQAIPQAPALPPVALQNEFTVNIPNDHGGYTAVVIQRSGNGFTGPQGEFYPAFPTVAQLKIIYGK